MKTKNTDSKYYLSERIRTDSNLPQSSPKTLVVVQLLSADPVRLFLDF